MIGLVGVVPFKIVFVEKKPLWEMIQCGAHIVWSIHPSRTGVLFELGFGFMRKARRDFSWSKEGRNLE